MSGMVQFVLYSRSYCHLCDDMLAALHDIMGGAECDIEVIDVDQNDELLEKYDELVPVLVGKKHDGTAVRLCNYFLDESMVRQFLVDL